MNLRQHLIETLTLVIVAVLTATIFNAFASRDRKLAAVQEYPNSTEVPSRDVEEPALGIVSEAEPVTAELTTSEVLMGSSREEILDRFPATPDQQYVEVVGDDVTWLWVSGALFLDARRTSVFEEGHIMGARSFSIWESDIDDKIGALFEEVDDQEMPIVVYCSGGDCEDSHMLADKLWGVFFSNVLVYKDGFPDWQERGGSVLTGSDL